jgi:hypothetical protein
MILNHWTRGGILSGRTVIAYHCSNRLSHRTQSHIRRRITRDYFRFIDHKNRIYWTDRLYGSVLTHMQTKSTETFNLVSSREIKYSCLPLFSPCILSMHVCILSMRILSMRVCNLQWREYSNTNSEQPHLVLASSQRIGVRRKIIEHFWPDELFAR